MGKITHKIELAYRAFALTFSRTGLVHAAHSGTTHFPLVRDGDIEIADRSSSETKQQWHQFRF